MAKVGMVSPWVEFYKKIDALFKDDPEVRVVYDEDSVAVNLYVESEGKADALTKLLPTEKTFGNVTLKIEVIPANDSDESKIELFRKAFYGNPALSYVCSVSDVFDFNYVVFAKKVVQYFNDDMGDVNGFRSTLYQDIAKDVFGDVRGVYFCTDVGDGENSLGAPLGEWP